MKGYPWAWRGTREQAGCVELGCDVWFEPILPCWPRPELMRAWHNGQDLALPVDLFAPARAHDLYVEWATDAHMAAAA